MVVWILDTSGSLFRRTGLSRTDWTGKCWELVPGPRGDSLKAIAVGQCDTLWALASADRVLQLSVGFLHLTFVTSTCRFLKHVWGKKIPRRLNGLSSEILDRVLQSGF